MPISQKLPPTAAIQNRLPYFERNSLMVSCANLVSVTRGGREWSVLKATIAMDQTPVKSNHLGFTQTLCQLTFVDIL